MKSEQKNDQKKKKPNQTETKSDWNKKGKWKGNEHILDISR